MEDIVTVDCFGTTRYEVLDESRVIKPRFHSRFNDAFKIVKIYNDNTNRWEEHPMVEVIHPCTVCGRMMLVRAIYGTTYLGCCSDLCYQALFDMKKDLGSLNEALRHFPSLDSIARRSIFDEIEIVRRLGV